MIGPALFGVATAAAREFLPDLVGRIAQDGTRQLANEAVGALERVTGIDLGDDAGQATAALDQVRANPETQARFIEELGALYERERTAELAAIAANLEVSKVDAQSEHWFQRNARPFILWSLGVECAALVFGLILALFTDPTAFGKLIEAGPYVMAIMGFQAAVAGVYVRQKTIERQTGVRPGEALPGGLSGLI